VLPATLSLLDRSQTKGVIHRKPRPATIAPDAPGRRRWRRDWPMARIRRREPRQRPAPAHGAGHGAPPTT
jgi:hypothetical protein